MENLESSFRLQERTALVIGPYSTTTNAIASRLTQLGASVALVDQSTDGIQRLASQLMDAREVQEKLGRAAAFQTDFSKLKDLQDVTSRVAESFGGIDIFIDGRMSAKPLKFRENFDSNQFEESINANLRATLILTKAVLPFLESRRRGRIIYLLHDILRAGAMGYGLMSSSRGGLIYFAKSLARELASYHVTVNCLAIGVTEELLTAQTDPKAGKAPTVAEGKVLLNQSFPNARITEPDQIANMVAYLASSMGAGISGQTIAVSDGLTL